MKNLPKSTLKPLALRLESLENRELLSVAPWSAPVDSTDAQVVETAPAQLEQDAVIDLSNAQLDGSVSFVNTGVTDNQYSLSWEPIEGASTYSVKINRDGEWIQYNKGLTETSCDMNGLYAGKTYDIRVCAMNANGRLTGDYIETTFAPVRVVRSVNKFVGGDELGVSVLASEDASYDIAWYYATPGGDVEITEACGLLTYAPTNPKYDVKVVVTGTGLSEGSVSETLFVYSGDQTVETNYDPESKTLQVVAPEVDGAVKYYIWKPAPSGNMAIYQRTTEPVFTVSNLYPGTTTDFRVSAYDEKGTVLDSIDFKFASVALNAPEIYKAGNSLEVAVRADASLNYDLSWYYVTESGDVEITEAKGLTAFTPDAATYPIKIVATPIADVEGLCVSAPVEAIVDPYVPQFGLNDPYVTTKRSFVTTWDAVPNATRYAVQKLNASGAWVKMTAFDVVDGEIVGGTRVTLSEDGAQFSYSVNMAKIGVEETYRVLAIDANGAVIESGEFTYNPVGLTVENDAYDLANGSQTLRAVTVQGIDDSLQYQWYYSTNDDPTNWQILVDATSAELVLSADEAAQNYNYKVLATDPNEERQSVSFARADTLDAPTNVVRSVDETTGDLLLTWNADASLSADNFIVQYYRNDGEYSEWGDLPQGTIVANGDGTFSLTHVNGEKYETLRVRAVDETGWSEFKVAGSESEDVEDSPFLVNTPLDVVDANDGVNSLREAVSYYLDAYAAGTLPEGAKVMFDPKVFTAENHTIVLDAETSFNLTAPLVVDATDLDVNVVLDATASTNRLFTLTGEDADVTL
ncbi:MAG: fibronectin type III domain-containing protein, partial [Thermoguttaceae bacterium]